jgi:ATP-dependent Clp protease ATP-binding subunit ClpC
MNSNFTDRLRNVLVLAREEARRLQHDYVGTEHILLGLMREGEGVATTVLSALGLEMGAVQNMVYESVRRGKSVAPAGELPLSSRSKKVLDLASMEASAQNHSYVSTEHLLPALLREEKGIAAEVLGQLGITLEDVRAETRRLVESGLAPRPDEEDESFQQGWPTIDELKRSVANTGLSLTRLSIVADVDIVPAAVLAEFIGALDGLHRAWGGAGLIWESGHVGVGPSAGVVR